MTPVVELDDTTAVAVRRAVDALAGCRIAVLTGAGVSTDSGIPDYRGKGAPTRTPMTWQTFRESEAARRRYWVGSHLGWRAFSAAAPNAGHAALAELERHGLASGVVTQNVDGLHLQAGSRRVIELHGTMRRVGCTACGQVFDRRDLATRIEADNPWITVPDAVDLGPDGDELLRLAEAQGGHVLAEEDDVGAEHAAAASGALLVAGSSLVVNSGVRLVERARRRRLPVVIVNRGETRADRRASVKIDGGTTEVLEAIAGALLAR